MDPSDNMIARVHELLLTGLGLDIPSPETDLIAEGVLDSLVLVEVLLNIEQEFGLEIPLVELDLDVFRSVKAIARFLSQRLESDAPRSAG
jgi:acyl carrier protein